MSAPIGNQSSGLRVLAQRLNFKSLMKATGMRESEALHLLDMLRDAADTLDRVPRGEGSPR